MLRFRPLLSLVLALANPVSAQNRASPPLGELPDLVFSADYPINVEEIADGLQNPWSLQFLPGGDILITERPGRLRIVRDGVLDPVPIAGVPEVRETFLAGLLDVLLHPDFESNRLIYLSYAKAIDDSLSTTAVARARFDGRALSDADDIFVASTRSTSATNFGGRMVFGNDGRLYMTVGERQEQERAQDPQDHAGKVVRLNDDGSVPDDNPFVGDAGWLPEIFTLGHRSPQGLAVHPDTGEIWEHEHGPLGGDEINVLIAGGNYGWPLVSYGLDYDGTQITESGQTELTGYLAPRVYWVPSIAPSGMVFLTSTRYGPAWQGNLFVGALAGRFLDRIEWQPDGAGVRIVRETRLLTGLGERIRDVRQGPVGLLYLLTDAADGRLIRLLPE
jgi:glucose/arabinose dehydrogenase